MKHVAILIVFACVACTNAEPTGEATQDVIALDAITPGTSFDGAAGGCGDLFAYRANADATQYIHVDVYREKLGLPLPGSGAFEVPNDAIHIGIDVYGRSVNAQEYCND